MTGEFGFCGKCISLINDLDDNECSGVILDLTAGEGLAFPNIGYLKADGKVWKSDASAAGTMPVIVMAMETIAADAEGRFLVLGLAKDTAWAWTIGAQLYASGTAGAITETAPAVSGDQVQKIGVAISATLILFNPDLTIVVVP